MKELNAKEQAVLDYICNETQAKGYAPSVRDIGEALGYKSTSTVQMYLDRLLSYGVLCRESGKSRSLRVSPEYLQKKEGAQLLRIPCYTNGNLLLSSAQPTGQIQFAYCGEKYPVQDLFALPAAEELNGSWLVGVRGVTLTEGERALAIDAQGRASLCTFPFAFGVRILGKALAKIHCYEQEL